MKTLLIVTWVWILALTTGFWLNFQTDKMQTDALIAIAQETIRQQKHFKELMDVVSANSYTNALIIKHIRGE